MLSARCHLPALGTGSTNRLVCFRPPCTTPLRRHRLAITCAAAGNDPFKTLGIPRDADFKKIQQAYNNKRRDAKNDEAKLADIEAAYNQLFMTSLTARVQGKGVTKEIQFADKPKYFPWRPRKFVAERTYMLVVGALQAAILAWGLFAPMTAGQQPVIAGSMVGAIANIYKQNMIFPPPSGPGGSEDEKKQGFKNIVRGIGLAVLATFAGCFLAYTLPDIVSQAVNRVMPYWFYEYETTVLTAGTCVAQAIMSCFFR